MAKSDRAILVPEGIVVGDTKFKPGDEKELASADVPQWNLQQMIDKGFISGDWSKAGLTPEEEAKAVAEAVPTPAVRTNKK